MAQDLCSIHIPQGEGGKPSKMADSEMGSHVMYYCCLYFSYWYRIKATTISITAAFRFQLQPSKMTPVNVDRV